MDRLRSFVKEYVPVGIVLSIALVCTVLFGLSAVRTLGESLDPNERKLRYVIGAICLPFVFGFVASVLFAIGEVGISVAGFFRRIFVVRRWTLKPVDLFKPIVIWPKLSRADQIRLTRVFLKGEFPQDYPDYNEHVIEVVHGSVSALIKAELASGNDEMPLGIAGLMAVGRSVEHLKQEASTIGSMRTP